MSYIPPEEVEKARRIDLLTYLKNYESNELVHISGNNYTTKTHDSLKISNGLWNWFSKGIGGKNAIDYLIKVRGYSFTEAVEIIIGKSRASPPVITNKEVKQKQNKIIIPSKDSSSSCVKDYLMNRGIDEEIIDYCIKNNYIYQEEKTQNVVFVGYDNNKNIRYAGCRATNETRYMRDATGSDKMYSFRLLSEDKNDTVHLFESSIDLLSYATILKYKNKDWTKENLIALAGVYQPAKIIEQSKMPVAIQKYLSENKNIVNIVLHFDRDIAGRNATKAFQIITPNKYNVIDIQVPFGKDVNDFLCYTLGLKRNKIINKNERNL